MSTQNAKFDPFRFLNKRKEMFPSQRKFSAALRKVGVNAGQSHISAIERGEREPSLDLLGKMAIALETNLDYLFGLTDDAKPQSDLDDQVIETVEDPMRRQKLQQICTWWVKMPEADGDLIWRMAHRLAPSTKANGRHRREVTQALTDAAAIEAASVIEAMPPEWKARIIEHIRKLSEEYNEHEWRDQLIEQLLRSIEEKQGPDARAEIVRKFGARFVNQH